MSKEPDNLGMIVPELRRFGWTRIICRRWLIVPLVVSAVLTIIAPMGRSEHLPVLLQVHGAMLGFSMTVFGFVILGGKDDFFEPIMARSSSGVDMLRNMVLILFWPLVSHFAAMALCSLRLLLPQIGDSLVAVYAFRVSYGFVTVYSFGVSFLSARYLFRLAIIRLVWRNNELQRSRDTGKQSPDAQA